MASITKRSNFGAHKIYVCFCFKIKMYIIGLYFKPIQMYTHIIDLNLKAKSSMYISSLKTSKISISFILKLQVFFKTKVKKGILGQIFLKYYRISSKMIKFWAHKIYIYIYIYIFF